MPMEHLELINKIVEAEQNAQEIAKQAEEKRQSLAAELKAETEKLRAEFFERADKRIAAIARQEKVLADEMFLELERGLAGELSEVERVAAENKALWADKIFSIITGRQEL